MQSLLIRGDNVKILKNESLKKYTTVKIGGVAKKLSFPESRDELIEILEMMHGNKIYILSGGSNLLINDQKVFDEIICLKLLDTSIENLGQGNYYIGASLPLQRLIIQINDDGYGGIEYLFSVPALLGGAVAMNAGRGKVHKSSIADYIKEVHVYDYDERKIKTLSRDECQFSYRKSIFREKEMVVLGAILKFPRINIEDAKKQREDRIKYAKKLQDNSGYNFGSVFREYNKYILQIIRLIHFGYKDGMMYSKKTSNWLINKGSGSFNQTIGLIEKVIRIHRFLKMRIVLEVIIWD
jgi:UDP-N-acetylmuramate dehydrogenase